MLTEGKRFAGYKLERRVGHGGMGVVYRACEVSLQRTVALRIVPPAAAADPILRARLNRESVALASVDHPNVAPIYAAGEHDGTLFIATRWIDGENLGELVKREGALNPRRAARIVIQIASALQAAHAVGIMHRGIRPSSVLVTPDDHAYLTDFELARRASDLSGLTVQEQLVGEFDFIAPEYIRGGEVDARVDIYGLGCVLYVALTGEVPFPRAGSAAKMYAHVASEPPSPRSLQDAVPERLDAVARRAMATAADERQQTAGEFAIQVAGALDISAPPWATRADAPPLGLVGSPVPTGDDTASRPLLPAEIRERPDGTVEGIVLAPVPRRRPRSSPAAPGSQTPSAPTADPEPQPADGASPDGASPDGASPDGAPADPERLVREGYDEPVYYAGGRRRRGAHRSGRRAAIWVALVLVFLAAPVALLIALSGRASAAVRAAAPQARSAVVGRPHAASRSSVRPRSAVGPAPRRTR